MTGAKTLAILPQCGIGDLIQHLWYLRSIARRALGGKLTIMMKTRSMAKEWIDEEPWVDTIEYLERKDLYKRAFTLRSQGYEEAWVFHRSQSHGLFAKMAGIPKRFGPGHRWQSLWTTNPPLPAVMQGLSHLQLMDGVLHQQGIILDVKDQKLPLKKGALQKIQDLYPNLPAHLIAFGVGASETFKKWPLDSFIQVAQALFSQKPVTFLLIGGPQDRQDIAQLENVLQEKNIPVIAFTQGTIAESFALLSKASLYIGNDTSLLNAAATLDIPSVGLFGATPILDFSPHIWPVYPYPHTPESRQGMLAITPDHVLQILKEKEQFCENPVCF